MSELATLMRAARVALALAGIVAAGCAAPKHTQPQGPVPPAAPPAVVAESSPAPIAPAPAAAPAVVAVAPVPAPPSKVVPKPAPAGVAAAPPPPAPLDLHSLETRLRQTRAVGVLTKLSLKNQVDDLVEKFRAYHKREARTTLAELRRNYDMLVLKVLSLLQDSDPPLARDIVKSRAAIWGILEDPRKFTEANLMAGATP
jgi:hypothetical protein